MYYQRDDKCINCQDCINDPYDVSCNTICPSTKKNCCESYKVFDPEMYAKANICIHPYEDLFNINDAFAAGTIFKSLYSPYCEVKYIRGCTL
ncbi:spore coat associated protein CotJA [Clostridium sp. SHJSY1]|uniref:spore coat associated protein CotJA n=1 Tax=Clostridium sp. SHJSY1 TaxID=2942483 RepID=UPI002874ACBE|nr:spore coat associated protein CotJA [Clostridium sp. SHJSY1]MDS0527366.1 spore coat associated protein CotJA [Clostridium sp. SHJSY1]